jgi:GTP-binding protein
MNQSLIRNVAIIAHVDHGKTTLVDELFKQSGIFSDHEEVSERLMDSMDLEKERGITIKSKNGSCTYKEHLINIIDTPGHADFGGEVERVLHMADGAVFLVDAQEGPMPQSYFVLKKAIGLNLPIIVVVNKIDKPAARCDWVIDHVFDLMVQLEAPDNILDFPIIYASAKQGIAKKHMEDEDQNIFPLLDTIIKHIPAPQGDPQAPFQFQISAIDYSTFLGRMAIGKITSGKISVNQEVAITADKQILKTGRITKIYRFSADQKKEIPSASCGEIVSLAGFDEMRVSQTITDKLNPQFLPIRKVDPPTISMNFLPNKSPFAGLEGEFVTSRHLKERLERELLSDVALHVEELTDAPGFKVSGRGELHIAILIEKMRREGYEFEVSRPSVLFQKENGQTLEPYEYVFIDAPEQYQGKILEKMGQKKGQLIDMELDKDIVKMKFAIPTRGLLGYHAEFMMDTKGMGIINYIFHNYGPYCGEIIKRKNGVMVVKETTTTIAYALFNLQERGTLFLGAGEPVYEGQIIGSYSKEGELVVNAAKGKKLTNVRASSSDEAVVLTPYTKMTLEDCLSFIDDDELVEVTPKSIRMRKIEIKESQRRKNIYKKY